MALRMRVCSQCRTKRRRASRERHDCRTSHSKYSRSLFPLFNFLQVTITQAAWDKNTDNTWNSRRTPGKQICTNLNNQVADDKLGAGYTNHTALHTLTTIKLNTNKKCVTLISWVNRAKLSHAPFFFSHYRWPMFSPKNTQTPMCQTVQIFFFLRVNMMNLCGTVVDYKYS